jgi:hypothetical protein
MIPILALMGLSISGCLRSTGWQFANHSDQCTGTPNASCSYFVRNVHSNIYFNCTLGGAQALYGNPGAGVKMIVVSSGQLAGTTSKPVSSLPLKPVSSYLLNRLVIHLRNRLVVHLRNRLVVHLRNRLVVHLRNRLVVYLLNRLVPVV